MQARFRASELGPAGTRWFDGVVRRVASHDSYIPLGPAADHVLLSTDDVVAMGRRVVYGGTPGDRPV